MNYKNILLLLCFIAVAFFFAPTTYAKGTKNIDIMFGIDYSRYTNMELAYIKVQPNTVKCDISPGTGEFDCFIPYDVAKKGNVTINVSADDIDTGIVKDHSPIITIHDFKGLDDTPSYQVSCNIGGDLICKVRRSPYSPRVSIAVSRRP